MVYCRHVTTNLRACVHRRGTHRARGGPAGARRLHAPPLSDRAGECAPADGRCHCHAAAVQRSDRTQRHPHLQPRRSGRLAGRIVGGAPSPAYRLSPGRAGTPPAPPAAQSTGLWQAANALVARPVGRGLRGRGHHHTSGQWRSRPGDAGASGHRLEARQTVDHQPRPPVFGKKSDATD